MVLKLGLGSQLVARAFYVWLSVYNLFVVSVFWSFMADLFVSEQGRRLFGFISAGGTAGILVGPLLVARARRAAGPREPHPADRGAAGGERAVRRGGCRAGRMMCRRPPSRGRPVGGGMLAGLKLLVTSPFLLALGLQTVFYTVTSSFLYILQVKLVDTVAQGAAARTTAFANIELWVQVAHADAPGVRHRAADLQAGAGGGHGRGAGAHRAGLHGACRDAGASCCSSACESLRGAAHYGLERPSREVLFTTVSREEKYKAKSFIDTVVYRGGDVVGGWLEGGLSALGLGRGEACC